MGDHLIMSAKERKRKAILVEVEIGRLSLKDAAQKMGVSYRQARRIRKRYKQQGDEGLVHGNRGRCSGHAYSSEYRNRVLKIYKEKYFNFGPTFAAEKMAENDGINIHSETLRLWLLEENLWIRQKHRSSHRQRRERRPRFGELLQIDGSIHAWFGKEHPNNCLLNIVDDATGTTLAQLDHGETCYVLLKTLRIWVEKYGVPKAVYVDLKSLYVSPGRLADRNVETTMNVFERVCHLLDIEIIKAYSPQAKGRVERNHAVYQDRFLKELGLRKIVDAEVGNAFLLNEYLDKVNSKFAKKPASPEDAHCPAKVYGDLEQIFCWEYMRQVQNDFTLRFNNELLQLEKRQVLDIRSKQDVAVRVHLDGTLSCWYKEQRLNHRKIEASAATPKVVYQPRGYSSSQRSEIAKANKHKSPWSRFNTCWLNHKRVIANGGSEAFQNQ